MIGPARCVLSLCLAGLLAMALSCSNPADSLLSGLQLRLASELGTKRDFFEGEPIYVVFALTNHAPDTVWTRRFSFLQGWVLDGEVTDSVGNRLDKWGFVVDGGGYRGEPLAPGMSRYQIWLTQDRWGWYRAEMDTLYFGHHLPPGRYTLRMRFPYDVPGRLVSRVLDAEPITFRVHTRSAAEEQSFQRLYHLAGMSWDTTRAAALGDSVMANVQSRSRDDPIVPLLRRWAFTVRESLRLETLVNALTAVARAQRTTAAGAYGIVGVDELHPASVPGLARELSGSLAGDVATSLANR